MARVTVAVTLIACVSAVLGDFVPSPSLPVALADSPSPSPALRQLKASSTTLPTTVTMTPPVVIKPVVIKPGNGNVPNPCAPQTTTIATTVTTTPATTVTTTPAVTVTTTPAGTVTTTLPTTVTTTPGVMPGPCAPQVTPAPTGMRLFNKDTAAAAEQQPKKENAMLGWTLPMIGAVAMLSFAAMVGMRIRRGSRSTRNIQLGAPISQMSDDEMEQGLE